MAGEYNKPNREIFKEVWDQIRFDVLDGMKKRGIKSIKLGCSEGYYKKEGAGKCLSK